MIKTVKHSRINHTAFSVIMALSILKDHARVSILCVRLMMLRLVVVQAAIKGMNLIISNALFLVFKQ